MDRVAALQDMRKFLPYRVDSLARADTNVKSLDLSPLNGKLCDKWPGLAYEKLEKEDWKRSDRINDVVVVFFDVPFLTLVGLLEKQFYGKCLVYAFKVLSVSGMSLRGIEEKVEELTRMEQERARLDVMDAKDIEIMKGEQDESKAGSGK